MAEKKKKRKSIYDKPLKDINKDGKVNFGDTWLGDALGFDGKVGIQKGRPGLKESLKGARRGKEPKPTTPATTRPRKRPAKGKSEPLGRVGEAPKPGPARGRPTDSGMDKKAAATRRAISAVKAPTMKKMQDEMTPTQSKTFQLLSPAQRRQMLDNYKKTGNINFRASTSTFQERRKEAQKQIQTKKKQEAEIKNVSPKVMNQWSRSPEGIRWIQQNKNASEADRKKAAMSWQAKQTSGMAQGGMARFDKTGKRDYKGKGMFYDSKSPRGYK